jgi:hypothetical protein
MNDKKSNLKIVPFKSKEPPDGVAFAEELRILRDLVLTGKIECAVIGYAPLENSDVHVVGLGDFLQGLGLISQMSFCLNTSSHDATE